MVQTAQPGTWESPIAATDVAAATATPTWVSLHDGQPWWTLARPDRGGAVSLLRAGPDGPVEVIGDGWDVRNHVHEYGGRPFTVLDGQPVFTEASDGRLYTGADPTPLTPADPDTRYSDLTAADGEVWCVREITTGDGPVRDLVAVTATGELRVLGATHRFMSAPQPSPDGRFAAWLGWNHPDMPWDSTQLCVAALINGRLGHHRVVAGGPGVSVCQVRWEAEDSLLALADPHGWWTLCRIGLDGAATVLADGDNELGGPLWELGRSWFAPLGRGRHAVLRSGALAILDERSRTVTDVDTDYPVVAADLHAHDGVIASRGAGPTAPWTVFTLDLSTGEHTDHIPTSTLDPAYLPHPEPALVRGDGHDIPVLLYPPTNPDYTAPDGHPPPWLLYPHSGPTTAHTPVLDLDIAYFTSRGFGVAAVDYAGSTGHGRAHRELLHGHWGVLDVADTLAVATHLLDTGAAHPKRLAVRGASAGGLTAAAAMTDSDVFAAATLTCPILDLSPWADGRAETHDFESHYVHTLIGALPEHAHRYRDRSPAGKAHHVTGPILIVQGADDPVCPPQQSARFAAALTTPHALLSFDGERHGLRAAAAIAAAHEAELSFYGQVFGFTPPGVPALELTR
ncbi:alpha/beta hydrolase family protein [Actinokineospora guangxiensis]|uniref:Alpha/beta hydrolase family protein n=1 Tax=Actinokineospora guangxiensis TaxID=1490288 RepID=A0ABW0EQX4_9PSEU